MVRLSMTPPWPPSAEPKYGTKTSFDPVVKAFGAVAGRRPPPHFKQKEVYFPMKVLKTLDKILGVISGLCSWVSGAALFLIAAITFVDVFCRYFLHNSITGSQEMCQLLMVFVVYFALGKSTRIRAHVQVDFLINMFPKWLKEFVVALMMFACIFVTWNITLRTWGYAGQAQASKISTVILSLPHYPFYYIISVMNVLISLEFLADGVKHVIDGVGYLRDKNYVPRYDPRIPQPAEASEATEGGAKE